MRILINRHIVDGPWGGGNQFVRAFREGLVENDHAVTERLDGSPDAIIIAGIDADSAGISAERAILHRRANPRCKLAIRLNECDARKGTDHIDRALLAASRNCDLLIFVTDWLREHLIERWSGFMRAAGEPDQRITDLRLRSIVIHNGVDREIFRPSSRAFDPNVPLRVVAHHWSDNPLKGRPVYEALDAAPGIKFTYVGRHLCRFNDPSTTAIPPLQGRELAAAISDHDVYVSGSLWDPGPNHILEALSCNLPTWVHRSGGGGVEFAGIDHSYENVNELISILAGSQARTRNTYAPVSWSQCIARYCRAILEM
jgi:glycosyltransferase involved in cell wall biosynthesis